MKVEYRNASFDLANAIRKTFMAGALLGFSYVLLSAVYALLFTRPDAAFRAVSAEAVEEDGYFWRHHDTYGLPYKPRGL